MIIKLQNHSTTLVLFRIVCNIHGLILSYLHCSFDLCTIASYVFLQYFFNSYFYSYFIKLSS